MGVDADASTQGGGPGFAVPSRRRETGPEFRSCRRRPVGSTTASIPMVAARARAVAVAACRALICADDGTAAVVSHGPMASRSSPSTPRGGLKSFAESSPAKAEGGRHVRAHHPFDPYREAPP